MLVLDASAALAWILDRTESAEIAIADLALQHVEMNSAEVPALWLSEVANGLLVAERRHLLTPQETASYLADLAQMPIAFDPVSGSADPKDLVVTGRRWNLSAYDATYLDLAIRRSATLATFDRKLAEAARAAGVRVFGDPPLPRTVPLSP